MSVVSQLLTDPVLINLVLNHFDELVELEVILDIVDSIVLKRCQLGLCIDRLLELEVEHVVWLRLASSLQFVSKCPFVVAKQELLFPCDLFFLFFFRHGQLLLGVPEVPVILKLTKYLFWLEGLGINLAIDYGFDVLGVCDGSLYIQVDCFVFAVLYEGLRQGHFDAEHLFDINWHLRLIEDLLKLFPILFRD
jgi:hypothetical protein